MNKFSNLLVYLTFLTTPLESLAIAENFSIVKLVTIFLFVVFFITILNGKTWINISEPFISLVFIYTLVAIISTIWSIEKEVTFKASVNTILPTFFVTLIIYNSLQEKVHIERAFKAYIIGCGVASSIALFLFITGHTFEDEGRLTVLGQDQNELSFLLSFGIVAIIYLLKNTVFSKATKILLLIIAIVYGFIILTTGSRMGFIILLTIAITMIFENIKGGRVVLLIPIVLILGFLVINYLPSSILERLFESKDQIKSLNLSSRGNIWKMGWSAFNYENAYIIGLGFNTFYNLVENYYHYGSAAHNTYLSTFIELGFLGFTILSIMIIYLLNKIYYLYKKLSIFYILLILPLLMAMLVLSTSTRRWFYIIGVLIIKIWELAKKESLRL